nr:reverse transcriptase domain-containing protein [Tanacetum cinerariifolium]
MSAMANATPIVTTVTKPATNPGREKTPRNADATPRVNIQDFCEEYYEDILPIIMKKICRDKRKEVHVRLDFGEGSRERRITEGSHYSSARTLSARPDKTSPRDRSRNRSRPHKRDSSNGDRSHSRECSRGVGESYDNSHSSYGTNHGYRYRDRDRSLRMKRGRDSESLLSRVSESAKKVRQNPIEIHNINQKDRETIKDFMERFKVETRRMKGAPECMRIFGFMHGVNNPELTKRLNEHVPKTMEEMMITTAAFIRGKAVAAGKKKVTYHGEHRTSQSGTLQRRGLTSEVSQGKEGGLAGLPPYKDTEINSHDQGRKVPSSTTYGSSMKVLYEHCFNRLRPKVKNQMVPATTSLTGFSGETYGRWDNSGSWIVTPFQKSTGKLNLSAATLSSVNWMLIKAITRYSWQSQMRRKRFPHRPRGVLIYKNAFRPQERWRHVPAAGGQSLQQPKLLEHRSVLITSSKKIPKEAGVRHENFKVALRLNFPGQEPSDMTGVLRSVAEHRLNIREGYSPVRQKKKGQAPERVKAIQEDLANVRRFHGFKQGMSAGLLPPSRNRLLRDIGETLSVLQLPSPRTIKEVQSLNGKLASLNRFLFKSAEKSLPLFKTLKKCIKKSDFHWTLEAKQAFKQLKQHLSELPLLVAPKPKEELIVYMSASYGAISAVLMTKSGMVQMPVYFVSRALQGPKLNYTPMEKLIVSLVFAAKRLWRNFQAHLVAVITDQPIKQIMSRPDIARRLQKWSVMLNAERKSARRISSRNSTRAVDTLHGWIVMCGRFAAFNNESEYEALIAGLRITAHMGVQNVHVSVDSKLVANQVLGAYVAKEENMIKYPENVKSLVLVEILKEKSIKEKEVTTVVEEDGPTWMTPIIEYLKEWTLFCDRKEERKLRIKARQYELLEGVLYRRSFLTPWLRCIGPLQADYVIREIYEGSCSMHAGPQSVVAKAIRMGYYWPTMHWDTRDMIRACNDC